MSLEPAHHGFFHRGGVGFGAAQEPLVVDQFQERAKRFRKVLWNALVHQRVRRGGAALLELRDDPQRRQAEAAAKLVDFLVNNESAAKIIQSDRGVPSNSGMRTAIQDLLTPQGKVEAEYIDQIGKMDFAPTYIGPTGSTAVSEITARMNTEVLFKRL